MLVCGKLESDALRSIVAVEVTSAFPRTPQGRRPNNARSRVKTETFRSQPTLAVINPQQIIKA
jgi:hypothetical protein